MKKQPELLAPAGNLEKLKIAILYGATAVYASGKKYSLRAGADNFSDADLREGVAFAHQHHAKVYVVLNSFLHDDDFEGLPEYLAFLESCSVDALIVSDGGVIQCIRQNSSIPIHLSTQASCLNTYSAKLWKELGVKRVIVGRELTIEQTAKIRHEAQIEVEMFIHGAMCMAYSGNCTISNYTAGRDSNRGGCIQSCRFPYTLTLDSSHSESSKTVTSCLMSSKDLRGLDTLSHAMEQGIDSLKIEGRMKSNLYVATTSSVYSRALNQLAQGPLSASMIHEFNEELASIPHRDYTDASLMHAADADSIFYHDTTLPRTFPYKIGGTILQRTQEHLVMQVQNSFTISDQLELITFNGERHLLPMNQMNSVTHQPLSEAKPDRVVLFPCIPGSDALNLVRLACPPQESIL